MADQQEILNTILLTRLNYFSLAGMLELYRKVGSATLILEHKNNLRDILPDASDKLVSAIQNCEEARKRAEEELEYDIRYGIEPIPMNDDRYPQRLKDCDDAPLILFYKGNANLNQQRVINIVGTRHCTPYGEDLIRRFITDLKQLSPNVLIMSGLAYGVDIVAHRQALACGYETIGVLAHGLDDLYPRQHRETAARMIEQGGLLTEFLTRTNADKINFVRRNRIVAGMSDACILIESAAHGGGLITCRGFSGAHPGRGSAGRERITRALIDPNVFSAGAEQLSMFAPPAVDRLVEQGVPPRAAQRMVREEAVQCLARAL